MFPQVSKLSKLRVTHKNNDIIDVDLLPGRFRWQINEELKHENDTFSIDDDQGIKPIGLGNYDVIPLQRDLNGKKKQTQWLTWI